MGWLWFVLGAWVGSCGTAIAVALVIDRDELRARRLEVGTDRELDADD